jgi:hypothetical protein
VVITHTHAEKSSVSVTRAILLPKGALSKCMYFRIVEISLLWGNSCIVKQEKSARCEGESKYNVIRNSSLLMFDIV